jgi:DNA polymerase-3 subunit delta
VAKESVTYDDLIASLKSRKFQPLYLLYGEEDFLVEEATQAIIEAALGPHERQFNLDVLTGSEADIRHVIAIASSFPMMAERRVVALREVDKLNARELDLLTAYAEQPSPTTSLVLAAGKADMRKNPFAMIRRSGCAVECKPLYEDKLPAWIDARIHAKQRTITPEASKMLVAYVGTSMRGLNNEIDKLLLYLQDKQTITADDVSAVVGMSKEYTVFELQKAIGLGDLARAAEILQHMLDAGENVPFILIMLTSYFVALWKLHDLRRRGASERAMASEARISPYFLREYLGALDRYAPHQIEDAFLALAEADVQVKTTSSDPRQVMHVLLVRLLAGAGEAASGENS